MKTHPTRDQSGFWLMMIFIAITFGTSVAIDVMVGFVIFAVVMAALAVGLHRAEISRSERQPAESTYSPLAVLLAPALAGVIVLLAVASL